MKSVMTERVYQEGTIYLYSINNEGLDKLNPARVTSVPTNKIRFDAHCFQLIVISFVIVTK